MAKAEHDPGSLSLVLDHVRASLLLALGRPGAAGDFNAPEKILPCFRWVMGGEGKGRVAAAACGE